MLCLWCNKNETINKWKFCSNECILAYQKRASAEFKALRKEEESLKAYQDLILYKEQHSLWDIDKKKITHCVYCDKEVERVIDRDATCHACKLKMKNKQALTRYHRLKNQKMV